MMAAFDSTATPSGPDGLALNVNAAANALGMGVFDPDMPFDESILESVQGLQNMPYTPTYDFEPFSTTFEDPFSYPSRPNFTSVPPGSVATTTASIAAVSAGPSHGGRHAHHHHHGANDIDAGFADPESSLPDNDVDNKLLSFSAPVAKATLLDETGQPVEIALTAELYGMFFVAEDVFSRDSSINGSRPHELTCYRRNLWQCSGHVAIPRHVTHVALSPDQGGGITAPLLELAVSISAIESIDDKPTEIISIPWKSTNANATGGDDHSKSAGAPPRIAIDMTDGGQEPDGNFLSVPVSWKRLQFKHATANNGRRKGLQQHYVVQISLLGRLGQAQQSFDGGDGLAAASLGASAGGFVKLVEVQSGPVIVRGRSPRNFDSRRDVQLISDKKPERRSVSNDPVSSTAAATKPETVKGEASQKLQAQQAHASTQAAADWTYSNGGGGGNPHSSKRAAVSPNPNRPPVPPWSGSSESQSHRHQPPTPTMAVPSPSIHRPTAPPTLPINLSLSEDERSPPNRSSVDSLSSPQLSKGRTASGHNPGGSPVESADLLYEYFPLSLDDFLDPVDAVYRPHVVHHIRTGEENPRPVRGGTKRYFVPD